MTQKDWARDVAREIEVKFSGIEERIDPDKIEKIIEFHCPFKRDVMYEPVGETSRKLEEILSILKYMRRNS